MSNIRNQQRLDGHLTARDLRIAQGVVAALTLFLGNMHMQACGQWSATRPLPTSVPGWPCCLDPGLQSALPAVGTLPSGWRFCSPQPHQHHPVSPPCWYVALIIPCSVLSGSATRQTAVSVAAAAFVQWLACHMLLTYE